MVKNKKLIIVLLTILLIFISSLLFNNTVYGITIADSGFDTSYDSGGGWSSSSSSSSSSSYSSHSSSRDSSYDSSSSSGSYSGGGGGIDTLIWIALVVGFIIYSMFKNQKGVSKPPLHPDNVDENTVEEKIKKYIPDFDKNKFLSDGYEIYLKVQDAWMNFKLDDVHGVLTDELFNMYQSQLDTLVVKGEQNIMSGFELKSGSLRGVNVQNDNIAIKTRFVVDFYDYIIEQSSGKVLRGSKTSKVRVTYEMTFRRGLNKDLIDGKCPNCGGDISYMNGYGICQYCRTKIIKENQDWVLSDKKSINQVRL